MTARLLAITFFFCAISASLKAEETWYQVEYILFHHKPADLSTLAYEAPPKKSENDGPFRFYKETVSRDATGLAAHKLSDYHIYASPIDAELTLGDAFKRIKRDPRTKVYHYRHWQQGFESETDTLPVKIYEQLGPNKVLEGQVIIERERFLHAKINVSLKDLFAVRKIDWAEQALKAIEPQYRLTEEPWQPPGLVYLMYPEPFEVKPTYHDSPIFNTVRLYSQEEGSNLVYELMPFSENYEWIDLNAIHFIDSRRIKDKELHYIDHPYFGMIATIKRIENPNAFNYESDESSQTGGLLTPPGA